MKQMNILTLLVFLLILFNGCNVVDRADVILQSVKIDSTTSTLHTLLFSAMQNQDTSILIYELKKMGFNEIYSTSQTTKYNSTTSDSSIEIIFLDNQEIECIVFHKECTNSTEALDYFLQWSKQNRTNKSWYNFKGIIGKKKYSNYASFLTSISNDVTPPLFYYEQATDFCLDYVITGDSLSFSHQIGYYQYPL